MPKQNFTTTGYVPKNRNYYNKVLYGSPAVVDSLANQNSNDEFDRFFQYSEFSQSEPIVPGDIVVKGGHMVIYMGEVNGKSCTISASRDRGPIPGVGIEGIGLRFNDPTLNDQNYRFKIL